MDQSSSVHSAGPRQRPGSLTARLTLLLEVDGWQAAMLLVKRHGADAMLEASERAGQLLDEGDMAGAETWHRILNAIERLQAKAPAEGEKVH